LERGWPYSTRDSYQCEPHPKEPDAPQALVSSIFHLFSLASGRRTRWCAVPELHSILKPICIEAVGCLRRLEEPRGYHRLFWHGLSILQDIFRLRRTFHLPVIPDQYRGMEGKSNENLLGLQMVELHELHPQLSPPSHSYSPTKLASFR
jgi:hypothetical protein